MSLKNSENFPCLVTSKALQQYSKLPKKGKPVKGEEWTPMAAVLQHSNSDSILKVVSMGTGTKCIGEHKLNKDGWVINDSHAEVIARRQFVRYLLNQLSYFLSGSESGVFTRTRNDSSGAGMVTIKSDISFHFFSTQVPCGDAAIFPQGGPPVATSSSSIPENLAVSPHTPPPSCDSLAPPAAKRVKVECALVQPVAEVSVATCRRTPPCDGCGGIYSISSTTTIVAGGRSQHSLLTTDHMTDVHRTGAKCTSSGPQDPKLPGPAYHTAGTFRTKPGRGDPTRSMSCSDKILRWNSLGCQGALLSHFVASPIVMETFTMATPVFDREAVARAISSGRVRRLIECPGISALCCHTPTVYNCTCELKAVEECGLASWCDLKVAPAAISFLIEPHTHEVIVQGLKQGVNLKLTPDRRTSVSICKRRILEEFLSVIGDAPEDNLPSSLRGWKEKLKSYHSFKEAASWYSHAKSVFLQACPQWLTNDPDYEAFHL